jgi:hypothetical protein
MKRLSWLLPVLLAAVAGPAPGQAPVYRPSTQLGPRQPLLSPYLDLIRGGDPAANYYLGTIPERQRRQNTALFSSQLQSLEQQLAQPVPTTDPIEELFQPGPATGHPTAFMNLGGYFNQGTVRRPMPPGRRPPTGGTPAPTRPNVPMTPGRPN